MGPPKGSFEVEEMPCVLNGAVVSIVCTSVKMHLVVQFIFLNFSFVEKALTLRPLSLTPPKEEENDHQWQLAVVETTPKASFMLRREHCTSSSWFRVLYTFRETSVVTNYRNDPSKYSLNCTL